MTQSAQILESIHSSHVLARHYNHRRMIVLSGSESWCNLLIETYISSQDSHNALYVSKQTNSIDIPSTPSGKLHHILGSECDLLIWNGFTGLNPDGLGIATGLLKGGGLFFLLLPHLDELKEKPDEDYIRMCSDEKIREQCHTFFLQRLLNSFKQSKSISLFEEGKVFNQFVDKKSDEAILLNTTGSLSASALKIDLPTSDQALAISAIKKVAFGHRNRPLVIEADRGRGKSSALGIAAAQVYLERPCKIVITAPSKKTCLAAFEHYEKVIKSHLSCPSDIQNALDAFTFCPLDAFERDKIVCNLLLIDEAAAIPSPILASLLEQHSRIVFSTTVHGYEGNGQGFAVRFQKTLNLLRPQSRSLSLKKPIRWQENDPLENWLFRFLLLDAKLVNSELARQISGLRFCVNDHLNVCEIQQSELSDNETLLEQIISLLVTAHYQTSPSDLRLILDHPQIKILVAESNFQTETLRHVLGVCLIIEEGGITSDSLAEEIISATRRPRGHLFPQALCASSANPEFLKQKTYRVMRIAVHPKFQSYGIGTVLLEKSEVLARKNQVDSLSTSYGLSSELLSFWRKNKFDIVKLGSKVDGASGLQSVMMMRPVSLAANQLLHSQSMQFLQSFIFNLNRLHSKLDPRLVIKILQTFNHRSKNLHELDELVHKKIYSFSFGLRPFEECSLELFDFVFARVCHESWNHLHPKMQQLLVMKVLQARDNIDCLKLTNISGKNALDNQLRQAISSILNTET